MTKTLQFWHWVIFIFTVFTLWDKHDIVLDWTNTDAAIPNMFIFI